MSLFQKIVDSSKQYLSPYIYGNELTNIKENKKNKKSKSNKSNKLSNKNEKNKDLDLIKIKNEISRQNKEKAEGKQNDNYKRSP